MPQLVKLDRAHFLKWLVEGDQQLNRDTVRWEDIHVETDAIYLIWASEDERPTICIDDAEMIDFFAFVDTYAASLSPFSAFYRVVSQGDLLAWAYRSRKLLKEIIGRVLLGTLIVDAISQSNGRVKKVEDLSIPAVLATRSAVGIATLVQGYDSEIIGDLFHRYEFLAGKLGFEMKIEECMRAASVWNKLGHFAASDGSYSPSDAQGLVIRLLHAASNARSGSASSIWDVIYDSPGRSLVEFQDAMRGPREARVSALNSIAVRLRSIVFEDDDEREAIFGCLIASAGEGSLSYYQLADSLSTGDYVTKLWFGAFAGIHRESDVLYSGATLGLRLLKIFRQTGGHDNFPNGDISFEHAHAVQQRDEISRFRREIPSILSVELIPGVCGKFRIASNATRATLMYRGAGNDLKAIASQLNSIAQRLEGGADASGQQSDNRAPVSKTGASVRPKTKSLYKQKRLV